MRSPALITRVWLMVALFCMVAIGTSGFLLYRLTEAAQTYDRLFDREIRNQTSVRLLQVGFKKQVQEWKDILLRGRDPNDLKQFTDAFHAEDRRSQGNWAVALRGSVEEPAVKALLDQFIRAHETLDASYAAGLARFIANGGDPFEADRMVRGPTGLHDGFD